MGTKMGTEQIKNAAKPSKYGMFESSLYLRVPSRALKEHEKDIRMDILFSCYRSSAGHSKVRVSPLRSGRRRANVHRTFCDVSRSFL